MLYDYKCKCGHEFEEYVRITESDRSVYCAECGKQAKKIFTTSYNIAARNWRDCDNLKEAREYNP